MGNNVDKIWSKIIIPALGQTAYMTVLSIVISVSIAFVLAIVLVYTGNDGLKPNKIVYGILDVMINILRSVPFIILAVSIIPLTRFILKTSIGETAAVIPLSVASAPFIARLFENSFKKVDPSIIEAAKSGNGHNSGFHNNTGTYRYGGSCGCRRTRSGRTHIRLSEL